MKFVSLTAAMLAAVEAAEYGYGGFAPTYYGGSYGYGHGHTHSHTHDDDDDDSVDKSSWYNKYQQYSNPKIAYKPTTGSDTEYAICEISDTNTIQLAQMPGKAVMARVNFTGLTADTTYAIRAHENGTIAAAGCADIGDEYNPLTEKDKLGRANPYQDPTRGRFTNITTDSTGSIADGIQKDVLLNLLGHDDLIGRSLAIYTTDSDGVLAASPLGCCVIGYDQEPELPEENKPTHHHHSYPSYGHGYGSSYGGY